MLFALAAAGTIGSGCAPRKNEPQLQSSKLWRRYVELADERALAVAGNPDGRWIGSAAAGLKTTEQAQQDALEACHKRRLRRRVVEPCHLYAVGDEVVWPFPTIP